MMESSSNFSKFILVNAMKKITEQTGKVSPGLEEYTGLNWAQRLSHLRKLAKGSNKLTPDQIIDAFKELIIKNGKGDALEIEQIKTFFPNFKDGIAKFMDSEGLVDLTRCFCTFVMFHKSDFTTKMNLIFGAIDENEDKFLSKEEVTKFFTIILSDTFIFLKDVLQHKINPLVAIVISKQMPELEKIFDISKLNRLVNGAFTADVDHNGLISQQEWSEWIKKANILNNGEQFLYYSIVMLNNNIDFSKGLT